MRNRQCIWDLGLAIGFLVSIVTEEVERHASSVVILFLLLLLLLLGLLGRSGLLGRGGSGSGGGGGGSSCLSSIIVV